MQNCFVVLSSVMMLLVLLPVIRPSHFNTISITRPRSVEASIDGMKKSACAVVLKILEINAVLINTFFNIGLSRLFFL